MVDMEMAKLANGPMTRSSFGSAAAPPGFVCSVNRRPPFCP